MLTASSGLPGRTNSELLDVAVKNPSRPNASTPELAMLALRNADDEIAAEFGNRSINFIPRSVNGVYAGTLDVSLDSFGGLGWVAAACTHYIQNVDPDARSFQLAGVME